jgi:uridylate kinase
VKRYSKTINTDTIVIPGHGPVSNYQGLADYIAMLKGSHTAIAALVEQGKSLDEVLAAKPTTQYDAKFWRSGSICKSLLHQYQT